MSWTRDDSWSRDRGGLVWDIDRQVTVAFPRDEKWVRYAADVPPELAELLARAHRKSLGVNASGRNLARANLVRAALRMYLNAVDPEPDPDDTIDGTAEAIVELAALPPAP